MPIHTRTINLVHRHRRTTILRPTTSAYPYPVAQSENNRRNNIERDLQLFNSSSLFSRPNGTRPRFTYHETTGGFVSDEPRPSFWIPIYSGTNNNNNANDHDSSPLVVETTTRINLETRVLAPTSGESSTDRHTINILREVATRLQHLYPPPGDEYSSDEYNSDDDDDEEEEEDDDDGLKEEDTTMSSEERLLIIEKELESRVVFCDGEVMINGGDDFDVCAICLDELSWNTINHREEKELRKIARLDCKHKYHVECIKSWVMRKNFCPVCKGLALPALSS